MDRLVRPVPCMPPCNVTPFAGRHG